MEPYVQGQTTYSTFSPRAGNTRTSWLTGAAAWSYFSGTQYILGIKPEFEGLRIDPCIPSGWKGFNAVRCFRGKNVKILVKNPSGVCKGVSSIKLNGALLSDNLIQVEKFTDDNKVEVIMG